MITAPPKLFHYLARSFFSSFMILTAILLGTIFVFEFGELLRRAANQESATFNTALLMAVLKLPFTGEVLFPFAVLFASIHTCWRLNRTHELVVMRSCGLSVWQFLGPLLLVAFVIGVVEVAVINPVGAVMLSKFRQMETIYFQKNNNLVVVSSTGIWLRQPLDDGYTLLHASVLDQKDWRMTDVIVYGFDAEDNFQRRIDSKTAWLKDGRWEIEDALVSDGSGQGHVDKYDIPTDLTAEKIEESFANPDTISFWNLRSFIRIMEETGFPTASLQVHFQSLLAQPFLFAAMVLLAATFSLSPSRFRATGIMVGLGVATGFFIFFMESVLGVFGASQKIPVALAAWTPPLVGLFLGAAALLHIEDG